MLFCPCYVVTPASLWGEAGVSRYHGGRVALGQGRGLYDVFGLTARLSAEPACVLTKALGIFHGAASSPRNTRQVRKPAYHA